MPWATTRWGGTGVSSDKRSVLRGDPAKQKDRRMTISKSKSSRSRKSGNHRARLQEMKTEPFRRNGLKTGTFEKCVGWFGSRFPVTVGTVGGFWLAWPAVRG